MPSSGGSSSEIKLIVIVDDDEAVRDSLRFSLIVEGFAVRTFAGGQQLLSESPLPAGDCFVVDQNMPDMDGLDLIAELRTRNLTAPAILITSHPNAAVREQAAAAGVPIVEKPLLDFALMDSVRRSLALPSDPPLHP